MVQEEPPEPQGATQNVAAENGANANEKKKDHDDLAGLVVRASQAPPLESEHSRINGVVGNECLVMQSLMLDLKSYLDKTLLGLRHETRRDFDKVFAALQQESAKRTAMEQRLHTQLLLQSEAMVAMELKLLRLESKVEQSDCTQRQLPYAGAARDTVSSTPTPESRRPLVPRGIPNQPQINNNAEPTNMAVIASGARFASAVTAGSFVSNRGGDSEMRQTQTVEDPEGGSQHSTPTQGSRPIANIGGGNLDSILLSPMLSEASVMGHSVRATRGDMDGTSSLGTSVTNSTMTSTIIDTTTMLESSHNRQLLDESINRRAEGVVDSGQRPPRSRSNSPLTVQSYTVTGDAPSVTSASQSTTVMSSAAVAGPRIRRILRGDASAESRPLDNRVVSFSSDLLQNQQNLTENCDSITMPDELDNLSEVVDIFASSARAWRDDYEARLDALQRRWANE